MLSRGVMIVWLVGVIGCAASTATRSEPAAVVAADEGDRMVAAVAAEKARCPGGDCERACDERGDGKACALAAELYIDGKYGHPFDAAIAFRHATRGCEAGNGDACALLGQHHENGLGTPWAPEAAIAAYDKACRAGSGLGCLSLVVMYNRGHGVDVDRVKAKTYLTRARTQLLAACQGSEPRWCAHAALALDTEDPAIKAKLLALEERACARGAVSSCVDVVLDRIRRGVRPAAAALHQLEQLCTAGEARACSAVAPRLAQQASTVDRALPTVIRACELGHRDDCVVAGTMYERGVGTPRDDGRKRQYFARACERGSERGCAYLARDAFGQSGQEASFAQLARRACELGETEGCAMLVRNLVESHDEAAADRWAAEGCRRRSWYSCTQLVLRDRPLPELTVGWAKELAQIGCAANREASCQRLSALERAEEAVFPAFRDALSQQDVAAFTGLVAGDVALAGLWFDAPACTKQFSGETVLTAVQHAAFLRCLGPLGVHVAPHGSIDRTPALVYEPGVVLSLEVRDGRIRRIAAPRLATRHQASAPVGSEALVAHLVAGNRTVEPDAEARAQASPDPIAVQLVVCVDATGALQDTHVAPDKADVTAPASYVRAVQQAAEHWRWKPFEVRGKAVPVCALASFVYPADRWRSVELAATSIGPPVNGALDAREVSTEALDAHRIAGERNIIPDDATKRSIARARKSELVGSFKLCLTKAGEINTVAMLKSTGFQAYDEKIQRVIRTSWVYTPFWIDGRPEPVCTAVTFIYSQR